MTNWAPASQKKEELREVEARLEREPECVDLRFHHACLLADVGDTEAAKGAYLKVLARSPEHVEALNNLGTLLYVTGYRTAARSAYTEAIARHPEHPMAHVNLGNIFLEAGDLVAARERYEAALALDSGLAEAHQGLGNLLAELGNEEAAAQHQRLGLRDQRPIELPYRGEGQPVQVLLLASGRRGDVPFRHLLDDRIFRTFVVLPNVFDPDTRLPPHDVVFNAIADADSCALALDRAVTLMDRTFAPVINSPAAVLATQRAANSRRLSAIPGVVAPDDVRDFGANYRRYRVMTIDGWLYPLQLTAAMAEDQHRAEEEKFLKDMPRTLGPYAIAALADIQEMLGLDYAGIDFGLNAGGEVLLFEANAALTKMPTGREQPWECRRAAAQRVEDAARKMLAEKAQITQLC
jgi:TPR repeat/Tetratricopeptide repeat